MKTIEQRMKALEAMVAEIRDIVVHGKVPPPPGRAEYDRVIRATIAGDRNALDLYIQNGGVAFGEEEPCKPRKPYVPRKRVERPGKHTNDCGSPVILPAKERGAASVNQNL